MVGMTFHTVFTCCRTEKPIMMSPSGTSQVTVAESALRFMTDTLTGAGGRSAKQGGLHSIHLTTQMNSYAFHIHP